MALADVVHESQEPSAKIFNESNFSYFSSRLEALGDSCKEELRNEGFSDEDIFLEHYLHLRYDGTDCALMCSPRQTSKALTYEDFLTTFLERYRTEFGFTIDKRRVIVDDVRVRGVGKTKFETDAEREWSNEIPAVEEVVQVYFDDGYLDTNVYLLSKLSAGQTITGPGIIMDRLSTILVEPDCAASITKHGDVKITIGSGKLKQIGPELDSIQLSIFSHRFMSIAEQMGR